MDFGNISYAAIGSTTGSSTSSSSNDTSYRVNEDFDIDKNAKSVLKVRELQLTQVMVAVILEQLDQLEYVKKTQLYVLA